ncbi:MAG: galactokinase [Chitinophagales bacterium]|nr:galactokinase [Chitinophagales bacterium]
MRQHLVDRYRKVFVSQDEPELFFSPGRFNVIGEHLDYNGGRVLPGALEAGTWIAAGLRPDEQLVIYSTYLNETRQLDLRLPPPAEAGWWRYAAGAVLAVSNRAERLQGMNLLLHSTLPVGAGLSSSASVTVGCALAAAHFLDVRLTCTETALLCKKSENEFVGVPCGYLDPFAVACCRKGHALLLDCSLLHQEHIPVHLPDHEFVVVDSGTRRHLIEAPFRQRFDECRWALQVLERLLPAQHLADVSPQDLRRVRHWIGDDVVYRRARHVVTEQWRVAAAAECLRYGKGHELARLMRASHASLRDCFEVSTPELERLASLMQAAPGCLATRISGAGFGGSMLSLIERGMYEAFCETVHHSYRQATGLEPGFLRASFGCGAYRYTNG